jgi:RNA polymerase-binding transcription factor DksA
MLPAMDPAHAERIATERTRTVEQIAALQHAFDDIVAAAEDVSTDDEHDPEGHTIAWERQQTAALLASAREHLAELDLAVRRIEGGEYGRCEVCGSAIAAERLAALPTARTCVTCAR